MLNKLCSLAIILSLSAFTAFAGDKDVSKEEYDSDTSAFIDMKKEEFNAFLKKEFAIDIQLKKDINSTKSIYYIMLQKQGIL